MKRLIATGIAAGALAAGCSNASPETAPDQPAPVVTSSAPVKTYHCYPILSHPPTGDTPQAREQRRRFRVIYEKYGGRKSREVASDLGNLVIVYLSDCDTQITTRYGNPWKGMNGTFCEGDQLEPTSLAITKNTLLQHEIEYVYNALNDSQLCQDHEFVPLGAPEHGRP